MNRMASNRHLEEFRGKGLRIAALSLAVLLGGAWNPIIMHAAPPAPLQLFDAASAAPRPLEDATALAIQRDYAHAWRSLVSALDENRAGLLDENFTGSAHQQWQNAIHTQQQNGLSRHIIDHGHQVHVRFYSVDGSALEITDTADLEIQYREGSKVLTSERVQAHYLVLLTPAENSWKVRALQELPPG
jgi:hypothetical protein